MPSINLAVTFCIPDRPRTSSMASYPSEDNSRDSGNSKDTGPNNWTKVCTQSLCLALRACDACLRVDSQRMCCQFTQAEQFNLKPANTRGSSSATASSHPAVHCDAGQHASTSTSDNHMCGRQLLLLVATADFSRWLIFYAKAHEFTPIYNKLYIKIGL